MNKSDGLQRIFFNMPILSALFKNSAKGHFEITGTQNLWCYIEINLIRFSLK